MGKRDPRVDAYIERQADFARPILIRLRATIHTACPAAEETLKWGMPSFMHHGILCGIAGFKHHCALCFRQRELEAMEGRAGMAMGQFGRITRLADLPSRSVIVGYVKRAAELNESRAKSARPPATAKHAVARARPPRRPAKAKRAGARAKPPAKRLARRPAR